MVINPAALDTHLALGERASLVGTDDINRPKRLNGGEGAYEGVFSGHPTDPQC